MHYRQIQKVARDLERVGCKARRANTAAKRAKSQAEIREIATAILRGDYGDAS